MIFLIPLVLFSFSSGNEPTTVSLQIDQNSEGTLITLASESQEVSGLIFANGSDSPISAEGKDPEASMNDLVVIGKKTWAMKYINEMSEKSKASVLTDTRGAVLGGRILISEQIEEQETYQLKVVTPNKTYGLSLKNIHLMEKGEVLKFEFGGSRDSDDNCKGPSKCGSNQLRFRIFGYSSTCGRICMWCCESSFSPLTWACFDRVNCKLYCPPCESFAKQ